MHKEKEIGRWKIIEEELVRRGLPLTGDPRQLAKKGLPAPGSKWKMAKEYVPNARGPWAKMRA